MNYYLLSKNCLQVRNSLWFWKRKTYKLEDIKEIVFEVPPKFSDALRVITKDFRTTLHPSLSLQDKHWLALKAKLEEKGISVRNEILHLSE